MEKICETCGNWVPELEGVHKSGFCFCEGAETDGDETSALHSCQFWQEEDDDD